MNPELRFAPRADPEPLDLLVVGALTIDRFADGAAAPGGSVLYAARAASAAGLRAGVVTVAGDEPAAADGLRELSRLGPLHREVAPATLRFALDEDHGGRHLLLEVPVAPLACPPRAVAPRAVLYAPVADELGSGFGGQEYAGALTAAVLQGWLRSLELGREVRPLPLSALPEALVRRLAGCDLLIASRGDLVAVAAEPGAQLDALRVRFGWRPLLVVTDGVAGTWLDIAGRRARGSPSSVVADVTTLGSGDTFAAIMAAGLGRGLSAEEASTNAATAVVEMLAARRQP